MFDAHAHPGEICSNAFVSSASTCEYEILRPFRFKSIGTIAEGGLDPDFTLMEKAAKEGYHIGEIGLDRRWPDMERQVDIFIKALSIAKEYDRVAVLHTVREYGKTLDILRKLQLPRFIVHSFTGSAEIAECFIKLGGIISISPAAEKTKHFHEILKLPFVTETDMRTGKEERGVLLEWNRKLSAVTGIDIGERSERMMMEVLHE